jgi:hypothetical protein
LCLKNCVVRRKMTFSKNVSNFAKVRPEPEKCSGELM